MSGIAVGGLVTSTLSFVSQLRAQGGQAGADDAGGGGGEESGGGDGGDSDGSVMAGALRALAATRVGQAQSASDVAPAAFMYFTASACVIGACIAGYWAIPWLPYGRYKLLLAGLIDDPKERKMLTVRQRGRGRHAGVCPRAPAGLPGL